MSQFVGSKAFNLNQSQPLTLISDKNLKAQADIPSMINRLVDPAQLRQDRMRQARDKYHQLLQKIEFNDCDLPANARVYKYSSEQVLPYIHFLKVLAKKPTEKQSTINRLKVWIPDTVVLNDGDIPPMWLYSNAQGFVFRTDTFTSKNVISKLANYTSPDELVAVLKKQHFRNLELAGNDVKLICCRDMVSTVGAQFANKSELCVIQKFVKSNGPKAFICRTVWRKDGNPYCWIITNKVDFYNEDNKPEIHRYITNPRVMGSCTIVNTCRGKYVEETVPFIQNILTYLHIHLGITFKEFICDFIKDESGIWWLVNVKGYIFDQCPAQLNLKPITHYGEDASLAESQFEQVKMLPPKTKTTYIELCSKVKLCKYCEQLYPEQELQHKMTLKMVIQTDKHLYWRGKEFDWISRSDVTNLDVSNLYQEHKVCKQCYLLYTEVEKLIDLECYFNRLLGVPVTEDTQYQMLTLQANQTNNEPIKATDEFSQNEERQVFDISATKQLILQNDNTPTIHNTAIKQLDRFRFMVLIHSIRDIPQTVDMGRHYYLEYTMCEQKQRIKLDFSGAQLYEKGYFINVNRMRLFYFFSLSRKGIAEYIQTNRVLTMYLYQDQRRIGTLDLELQDFLSERVIRREFMKVFSGRELVPILSWGVNLTLGLVDSGPVNVTRIKLRDHSGLYLPNPDYYTSEPLPTEWMTILNQKKDVADHLKRTSFIMQQTTQSMPKMMTHEHTTYSRLQKDSLSESTKVIESQVQLLKELRDYECDEDEERKRRRRKKQRKFDDF